LSYSFEKAQNPQTASKMREIFSWVGYLLLAVIFVIAAIHFCTPIISSWLLTIYPAVTVIETFSSQLVLLVSLCLFIICSRKIRNQHLTTGLIGGELQHYFICCIGVVSLFAMFHLWIYLTNQPFSPWEIIYVTGNGDALPLVFIASGLIVPAAEEILYRGAMPAVLMKFAMIFEKNHRAQSKNFSIAFMVFSSICFAAAHASNREFGYLVYFFILGIWLGYWVLKTSSLSVAIVGHSLAGLLAVSVIHLTHS